MSVVSDSDWTEVIHPRYQRSFYYNRRTRTSTWQRPSGVDYIPSAPKNAIIALDAPSSLHLSESKTTREPVSARPKEEQAEEPVWEKHYHKHFGVHYYWHRHERRSTWTPPDTEQLAKELQEEETTTLCDETVLEVMEESEEKPSKTSLSPEERNELASKYPVGSTVRLTVKMKMLALLNGMEGEVRGLSNNGRVIVRVAGKNLSTLASSIDVISFNPFAVSQESQEMQSDRLTNTNLRSQLALELRQGKGSMLRRVQSAPDTGEEQDGANGKDEGKGVISAQMLQAVKLRPKALHQKAKSTPPPDRCASPSLLEALKNNVMFQTSHQKLCSEFDSDFDDEDDEY